MMDNCMYMGKMVFFFCLFFFMTTKGHAQDYSTPDKLDKKTSKYWQKGKEKLKEKSYSEAINQFNKVLENSPDLLDAYKLKAVAHIALEEFDSAAEMLEAYIEIYPEAEDKIYYNLIDTYERSDAYDQAIESVTKVMSTKKLNEQSANIFNRRLEELTFRKEAYNNPLEIEPMLLDSHINTTDMEYLPSFTADGNKMIFTRRLGTGQSSKYQQEDIFITTKNEDGSFSKAIPINEINTRNNEAGQCISHDGKVLIFMAKDRRDSYGGFDLYISFNRAGVWSKAYNMGPIINSRYWDGHPSISADGQTLYFSSNRPGGIGNYDIWKSELQKDGWGEPQNLGAVINTPENEESPFLHADGETMYFRSDGHIGLGGFDLFVARKDENIWSKPSNLSFPINTKGDEGALCVDLFGQYAYYTTDKNTDEKDFDIAYFKLPEALKPQPVSYVKLKVRDALTEASMDAHVEIKPLDNLNAKKIFDVKDSIIHVMPVGSYALFVEKEGYVYYSEHIQVASDHACLHPFEHIITLQPIQQTSLQTTEPIVLDNIFFKSGSFELLPESDFELQKLFTLLEDNPKTKIKIIGHTDNVGDPADNLQLSLNRANAVKSRLEQMGIGQNRILSEGKGEQSPIASNDDEAGRQQNRRTEFIVL